MSIKTKTYDDVGVLALRGKMMGGQETEELRNEIKSFLGEKINKMVIDLRHISWMNSLGVGALMAAYTTVRNADGDIRLSGLTEKVRSLMLLTQLIRVFKTYEKIEEAVDSFKTDPVK